MNIYQSTIIAARRRNCWTMAERDFSCDRPRAHALALRPGAVCILDVSKEPAESRITVFFRDNNPLSPPENSPPHRRLEATNCNEQAQALPFRLNAEFANARESVFSVVVQHRQTARITSQPFGKRPIGPQELSRSLRQRFLESADAAARDIMLLQEILQRL